MQLHVYITKKEELEPAVSVLFMTVSEFFDARNDGTPKMKKRKRKLISLKD